ncbi:MULTISPECIES: sugar-binding protein [unclassified Sphingobacterium]|uniref:sugar-binding protein n=1 Tax=unclassified Sphingobacterium TaxID=2609468 RepID=UPI0020C1E0B4|nr:MULTISPECIES: sugar-binding protein [unclassified Sphingobacterium]
MPKRPISFLFPFILLTGLFSLPKATIAQSSEIPLIPFKKNHSTSIDGNLTDWNNQRNLFTVDQFISPWGNQNFGKTIFKAFHDGSYFYFYFDIKDNKVVEKKFEKEEDVGRGDRGEIFLSVDLGLKEYYCFEISPSAKVLDYRASHYRKFDYGWDLESLEVKSKIKPDGYILEGKIPMDFIKSIMDSSSGQSVYLSLFRGEFDSLEWNEKSINWISWIRPTSIKPDFHIPSAFKKVQFGK